MDKKIVKKAKVIKMRKPNRFISSSFATSVQNLTVNFKAKAITILTNLTITIFSGQFITKFKVKIGVEFLLIKMT